MNRISLVITMLLLTVAGDASAQDSSSQHEGTFSIIGRDPATGELGMAVHSKTHAVGSRTITAKGGVAVVAHQSSSNPMYGKLAVDLLERGMTPQQALDMILRSDEGRNSRQVSILDIQGRSASWTGSGANEWKGHRCTELYCAQGNILVGPEVLEGLARGFESTAGQPLAERLVSALEGAQAAGGDARGQQSAALMIVKPLAGAAGFSDRVIDIRVDDHRKPIVELRRVLDVFRAGQMMTDANAKLRDGAAEEALKIAAAARDKAPESDNIWVGLAGIYLRIGRKTDCFLALRKAVELNPANRRQLPRNATFEPVRQDPEFLKIVG